MSISWLKNNLGGDVRIEKDDAACVVDTIISEIDCQMKEATIEQREHENTERRLKTGVDYSWLAAAPPFKFCEMSDAERLQLEDICSDVRPGECTAIICRFREILEGNPPIAEMPQIMKAVVETVIQSRPKEETVADWVTKRTMSIVSLTSRVRPISSKVVPVDFDGESERRRQSTVSTSTLRGDSSLTDNMLQISTLEDLV